MPDPQHPSLSQPGKEPVILEVLDARQLLRGRREVYLELDGVRYRLRLTRRNKLILQK